jgi:predicted Rossmann fold nucleotide-binding protein DprA/Smf involved in DNA uptake
LREFGTADGVFVREGGVRRAWKGNPGNQLTPNQLIKQGAKLVTGAEDVIEELPTWFERLWCRQKRSKSEQRNLMASEGLSGTEKKIYKLLSAEEPRPLMT